MNNNKTYILYEVNNEQEELKTHTNKILIVTSNYLLHKQTKNRTYNNNNNKKKHPKKKNIREKKKTKKKLRFWIFVFFWMKKHVFKKLKN